MKHLIIGLVILFVSSPNTDLIYARKNLGNAELEKNVYHLMRYAPSSIRNKKYIRQIVREATIVSKMKGNRWLTPQDLIGQAISESELQWWSKSGKYGLWDCGIMQNHTPLYSKTISGRKKLCKLLCKSTFLSFVYGANELNLYRNKYCLNSRSRYYVKKPHKRIGESKGDFLARQKNYRKQLYKCIFTLYNQGPNSRWRTNKYWLRTLCFVNSVEKGKYPKHPCRKMKSVHQLEYWLKRVK